MAVPLPNTDRLVSDMDRFRRDIDRLPPAAYETWLMLAGLREGRTLIQFTDSLLEVVNAVVGHATVSDSGKVSGPTGTVTFTVTVAPSETRPDKFVKLSEKLANKVPEDRSHVLFIGRGGTVHTREPMDRPSLFSVDPVPGTSRVEFSAGAESATDAPDPEDPSDTDRLPYKDD